MTSLLNQRRDGSFALAVDGSPGFDGVDETTYHQGLVLPGLALTQKRFRRALRVLIVGGAEGLSAREVLKAYQVDHLDIVDPRADVVEMAKNEIKEVNLFSHDDPRVRMHVMDVWKFLESASDARYDLIVSDMTVAVDASGTRFQSRDWFALLAGLLSTNGVVALSSLSPNATPMMYQSLFNNVVLSGLYPRAYMVETQSFESSGLGTDWGFLLGSRTPISDTEIESLKSSEQKFYLKDLSNLSIVFSSSSKVSVQPHVSASSPASAGAFMPGAF